MVSIREGGREGGREGERGDCENATCTVYKVVECVSSQYTIYDMNIHMCRVELY